MAKKQLTYTFEDTYTLDPGDDTGECQILYLHKDYLFLAQKEGIGILPIFELDRKRLLKAKTWEIITDKAFIQNLDDLLREDEAEKELEG